MPRARRHPARDALAVDAFVETFGATLTAAGLQRLTARVIALLIADEDGRMTAAEIGAALRVSPAAVSGAVAFLHEYGFITKSREPGSRRDVYVLQTDSWHDSTLRKTMVIGYMIDQLERGVEAVGGTDTQAGRRLAYSAEFYRYIADEMQRLITGWEDRRDEIRERYPH